MGRMKDVLSWWQELPDEEKTSVTGKTGDSAENLSKEDSDKIISHYLKTHPKRNLMVHPNNVQERTRFLRRRKRIALASSPMQSGQQPEPKAQPSEPVKPIAVPDFRSGILSQEAVSVTNALLKPSMLREEVADTILQQMGGAGRLRAMLGATLYKLTDDKGLGIKWPNRQSAKGNYVEITLQPDDTYKMEFFNVSAKGRIPVKEYNDVYFDKLIELFEEQTGWYLSLGGPGGGTLNVAKENAKTEALHMKKPRSFVRHGSWPDSPEDVYGDDWADEDKAGDTDSIQCPDCKHSGPEMDFGNDSEKECPKCGHTWDAGRREP